MHNNELQGYSLAQTLEALEETELELMARLGEQDPLFWMQKCTKTVDEQADTGVKAYRPFPERPYFRPLIDLLLDERVVFIEKSRTMMCSWIVSALAGWKMFTRPATTVVFQSEDADRAVHDVENVKHLWEHSIPSLRARWKLANEDGNPWKQAFDRLELANGSWCRGLSGRPDKSRSLHPTIFVLDEAAFMTAGAQIYNTVLAARPRHIWVLSSANPGWFREATEAALPVDWPEKKAA